MPRTPHDLPKLIIDALETLADAGHDTGTTSGAPSIP
jgi:hypothetical protein